MILSQQSIRSRVGMIDPFCERTVLFGMTHGLGPAGYDIRIKERLLVLPGDFRLASSVERFVMPNDLLARVCDKSSWARRGLSVFNTIIEPGWRGHLTLELSHRGDEELLIHPGAPIAQILFELLDHPSCDPYHGKYQDQAGEPVGTKEEE